MGLCLALKESSVAERWRKADSFRVLEPSSHGAWIQIPGRSGRCLRHHRTPSSSLLLLPPPPTLHSSLLLLPILPFFFHSFLLPFPLPLLPVLPCPLILLLPTPSSHFFLPPSTHPPSPSSSYSRYWGLNPDPGTCSESSQLYHLLHIAPRSLWFPLDKNSKSSL